MSAKSLTHAYGVGSVAVKYGLEESVFLDTIMFWWRTNRGENRNFQDGRWWTYNSLSTYRDIFPWWSARQLRRVITSCKEKGAILIGSYNEDGRDRTHWYTPSDELLEIYGETDKCICQNGQMQESEAANPCDGSDKSIKGNSATTSVNTTPLNPPTGGRAVSKPKWHPEWFETFWNFYPVHKGRQDACRAWDKLKPDYDFCRLMCEAVRLQKRSDQWTRDNGAYIPHCSRWLNGRKWEDEVRLPPPDGSGGWWADDPEVTD